jgi:glycine oxidase
VSHPVCIVGGGIIGLLAARALQAAGEQVIVFDRNNAGNESSWAGGGILSPLYPWRYPEAVTQLARWSQSAYPGLVKDLQRETGIDAEWVRSGLLILGVEDADKAVEWSSKYAISAKKVGSDDIAEIQPGLPIDTDTGFWMPEVAQVRNPRLLAAITRDLQKKEIEIAENEAVLDFKVSNGKLTGIETNKRKIDADRCIIAAGAWSGDLCTQLGLEVPVRPVRGQMLLFKAKPGLLQRIILKNDRYLIPRRDGRILIGSTVEEAGFDRAITSDAAKELQTVAVEMLPALADAEVEMQWAGLRPGSPTGVPYIDRHPDIDGLFVCAGHFRNGFVLGPASAQLMADLVCDRSLSLDPEPYRLSAGVE